VSAHSQILITPEFNRAATQLADTGRFLATHGWSPATSSNYSTKFAANNSEFIAISRSGIDKYTMSLTDVMVISAAPDSKSRAAFNIIGPENAKPSAETQIHTAIYQARPNARSILHTHSPNNTRLSLKFEDEGEVLFSGYEMQKGIEGERSHENTLKIPILPNSQDMTAFADLTFALLEKEWAAQAFLIAGHGLYTWGDSIATARRHVETLEFLFACRVLELSGV